MHDNINDPILLKISNALSQLATTISSNEEKDLNMLYTIQTEYENRLHVILKECDSSNNQYSELLNVLFELMENLQQKITLEEQTSYQPDNAYSLKDADIIKLCNQYNIQNPKIIGIGVSYNNNDCINIQEEIKNHIDEFRNSANNDSAMFINESGSHWVVANLKKVNGAITYQGANPTSNDYTLNNNNIKKISFTYNTQNDGHSCGIFSVLYAKDMQGDGNKSLFDTQDVENARKGLNYAKPRTEISR